MKLQQPLLCTDKCFPVLNCSFVVIFELSVVSESAALCCSFTNVTLKTQASAGVAVAWPFQTTLQGYVCKCRITSDYEGKSYSCLPCGCRYVAEASMHMVAVIPIDWKEEDWLQWRNLQPELHLSPFHNQFWFKNTNHWYCCPYRLYSI